MDETLELTAVDDTVDMPVRRANPERVIEAIAYLLAGIAGLMLVVVIGNAAVGPWWTALGMIVASALALWVRKSWRDVVVTFGVAAVVVLIGLTVFNSVVAILGCVLVFIGRAAFAVLVIKAYAERSRIERIKFIHDHISPVAQYIADFAPRNGLPTDTTVTTLMRGVATDSDGKPILVDPAKLTVENPTRFITLPDVWPIAAGDTDSRVTIKMPYSMGSWGTPRKTEFENGLAVRLKIGTGPRVEYDYVGNLTVLSVWPPVTFAETGYAWQDVMPFVAQNTNPMRVLLGLDTKGQPVWYDHKENGPHLKVSAGSGRGKSTLYRLLIPQYIRNGAQVVVLDVKGTSQSELATVLAYKNIRYYNEPDTCHDALQAVYIELRRRRLAYMRGITVGNKPTFAPMHVVLEEANTLTHMLRDFWEYAKDAQTETTKSGKASPAIRSMHYTVFMGREFGIFIHVIAQRAEAATFGGGAVRENFSSTLMSDWSTQTWKMLATGHKYQPYPSSKAYAWAHVTSNEVAWFLPPKLEDIDALHVIGNIDDIEDVEWPQDFMDIDDLRDVVRKADNPTLAVGSALGLISPPELVTAKEIGALFTLHGHAELNNATLTKRLSGDRSWPVGYGTFPDYVDMNGVGGGKRWERIAVLKWLRESAVEPSGTFFDADQDNKIERKHLVVKEHVVYALTVRGMERDYIGETDNMTRRYDQHVTNADNQAWKNSIDGHEILWSGVCTALEAKKVEAQAMVIERPKLNASLPMSGCKAEGTHKYVNPFNVYSKRRADFEIGK